MRRLNVAVPVRATCGAVLMVCLLGWTSTAAAQGIPACSPDKVLGVTLTSQERGLDAPLIATHEVVVEAAFTDTAVGVTLTPPAGTPVFGRTHGSSIDFVVPATPSVPITVSWRQAADPSDPESEATEPATQCAAVRVVTLPAVAARPSRAVKQFGPRYGADFAVVPALKRPDLSPLEISLRVTSRVRFPSAKTKARTMVVPLRTADQIKYRTRLPSLGGISTAKICRFYYLACGVVTSWVGALNLDTDALMRGVEKPDLDGNNAVQRLLPRTQPFLGAARYGVILTVTPGGADDRPFGFDVQVRQSGHLLARVRRAGHCRERRDARGFFTQCKVARSSTVLG